MKRLILILALIPIITFGQAGRSPYVTTNSAQTITGQKTFENTIIFNDTNYAFMKLNGLLGYGDWWWHTRNFYTNTSSRPDQVMRFGYNVNSGGGLVNSSEPGISVEMESFYDGNGYDAQEFHIAFIGTNSNPYRVITSNHRIATNDIDLTFNANTYALATPSLGTYWQQTTPYYEYWQIPHVTRFETNNYAFIQQKDKDSTAYLNHPYFNNENKYALGSIRKITSGLGGIGYVNFSEMDIDFDNGRGVRFIDADSNITRSLYYDSDRLRISAYQSDPIYMMGSDLYFVDSLDNTHNLVNPVFPFDTTGLNIGERYVDLITGNVKQVLGANLILNGDFSDWTGTGKAADPDNWVISWEDTTKNYVEQSPSGKMHFVYADSVHQDSSLTVYQLGATLGRSYGYSFEITVTGLVAVEVAGYRIDDTFGNITSGIKSGVTDPATHTSLFTVRRYDATEYCDVVIDNIRVWDMDGAKQQVLEIHVPDTLAITDGYTVKYVGGEVIWSPDVSTSGSGTFNPDGVTIDTTAGGLARVLPAKVTKWDSVSVKLNKADSTIYLTPYDASVAYATKSHTHTELFDTLTIPFGIMDTVTIGDYAGRKIENNITITEIAAYTNTGTVTFNIEERGETTPNTAGTDVMTSDLVADDNQQETTTFSNSGIARDSWLVLNVTSKTGDPTIFGVTIRYIKSN